MTLFICSRARPVKLLELKIVLRPVITNLDVYEREICPSSTIFKQMFIKLKLSNFWLDLHRSLAHQGFAKILTSPEK